MADPTIFEYFIQDDGGLTSRTALYTSYDAATETVASLQGAWAAYGGALDNIIDGEIVEGRITIPFAKDPAWKATPTAGNNANQVMNLNFKNDFNRYLTSILVPTYKEGDLDGEGRPDLADTGLAAFIALVLAGSGAVFANSRDLHDLNALSDAFLTIRKVRRQKPRPRKYRDGLALTGQLLSE